MLNQFRSRSNCETEAKFIQSRIHSAERYLADYCNIFSQYSRKIARLRDQGDEIAKISLNIAENENINKSMSVGLENFAVCMSQISDFEDMRVQTYDSKIVSEFAKYESICKQAKEEVKNIYIARDKEVAKKRYLDRARERNPKNRQQIIQAETELVKATAEVTKSIHNLENKTNSFEKQKLHDIKSILLDFISTEIGYHAKCLETLTKAFADIQDIDEEADLEDFQNMRGHLQTEFKKSLRLPRASQDKNIGKSSLFRSTGSLGSLGAIFSSTYKKKTPGIPNPNEKLSKSEETLDSMKHSVSESEEESETDTIENISSTSENEQSSPIARRCRK
ncbi:CBY1-interacting BAR domain-containing protein 1 [Diorhabda sublineata]|uniref:CBY1-interacting BAR domain-containing protein 1 n=1 Tax=Diorhabda sublineata TaxID=1163346 RepID=UPI0024E0C6A1|nr:CBY1-interacting BAR domain-containing protein 1 [Diorhabda sublineata]